MLSSLGSNFGASTSEGDAGGLWDGGAGAAAPATSSAPAAVAASDGYDAALDRVMAKQKRKEAKKKEAKAKAKKRPREDDGFVTATAELAAAAAADPAPPAPSPAAAAAAAALAHKKQARHGGDPNKAADADEKVARTIFVGNVPKAATKKQIERFFRCYGPIESVRTRSVATAGTKVDDSGNFSLVKRVCAHRGEHSAAKPTVNAYVVFKKDAAAAAAVEGANGALWTPGGPIGSVDDAAAAAYLMDGEGADGEGGNTFHLRVDMAAGGRGADAHLKTAFVGNCPYDATEEGLRLLFAAHLDEAGLARRLLTEAQAHGA